jgi:hypothetical protein
LRKGLAKVALSRPSTKGSGRERSCTQYTKYKGKWEGGNVAPSNPGANGGRKDGGRDEERE